MPDFTKGLEIFVDSDWAGNWDPTSKMHDPDTAKLRCGFIAMFAGVPVMWSSRLSTSVALSSMKAECIGLSEPLREAMPLMQLLDELKQEGHAMPQLT